MELPNLVFVIASFAVIGIQAKPQKSTRPPAIMPPIPTPTAHYLRPPPVSGPVTCDYKAQGNYIKVGEDMRVYETKNKAPKTVIICIMDIFGFHHNTLQFADKLSQGGGIRVVMPDFFRGQPFELEGFPPNDTTGLMNWLATKASWEKSVKQDVVNTIAHYKKQGITSFGVYGYCWGGIIAMKALSELDEVLAAVAVHPWNLKMADVDPVKRPVLLLPSKDEEDLTPIYEALKARLGEDKVGHHRFDDMHHGFAAARGDWTNELQRKRVDEAIGLVYDFMKKHVLNDVVKY